jgi:hypothetical protein
VIAAYSIWVECARALGKKMKIKGGATNETKALGLFRINVAKGNYVNEMRCTSLVE